MKIYRNCYFNLLKPLIIKVELNILILMDELLIGWIGIIKCAFKSAIIPRNSRLT